MSFRVFWSVLSVEGRKLMSYRADFWITAAAAFLAQFAMLYALWKGLFALQPAGAKIGGFGFEGMVVYSITAVLIGRLIRGQERDPGMSQDIYEGTLSRYLLYPCNYFWTKYAQFLGFLFPALVQLVVFLVTTMLLIDVPTDLRPTALTLGKGLVAIGVANLLWFLLLYPVHAVAFWADNVWTLRVMLRFCADFLGGAMLPLSLFPDVFSKVLWSLPFPYLFALPVLTVLGRPLPLPFPAAIGIGLLWCAALAAFGRAVWRRGILTYSGVGI